MAASWQAPLNDKLSRKPRRREMNGGVWGHDGFDALYANKEEVEEYAEMHWAGTSLRRLKIDDRYSCSLLADDAAILHARLLERHRPERHNERLF